MVMFVIRDNVQHNTLQCYCLPTLYFGNFPYPFSPRYFAWPTLPLTLLPQYLVFLFHFIVDNFPVLSLWKALPK